MTDYKNQVFELNWEDNNNRWALITITQRICDLVISDISFSLDSTPLGNRLSYSYTVSNAGDGPTFRESWIDELSISPTFQNGREQVLHTSQHQSNLDIGSRYSTTIELILSQSIHGICI